MANGQGVIQQVHVSPHYVISYPLHTDYKYVKELLVFLVYATIHSISTNLMFPIKEYNVVLLVAHYQSGAVFPSDVELRIID